MSNLEALAIFALITVMAGIAGGTLAGASFFVRPVDGMEPPTPCASVGAGCLVAAIGAIVLAALLISGAN